MRHALAVWLAGLLLAPATAAADGRLERLPGVHGRLWSSGTELLWESPHHFVRVADARRRVKFKIGIDKRCELAMASRTSLALIVCDSYDADVNDALVLHTRTGEITREPVPGSPLAVGRHWLYSLYNPSGCYHCETYYLTNRRTGRRRFAGDALFQKRGNLDAPDSAHGQEDAQARRAHRRRLPDPARPSHPPRPPLAPAPALAVRRGAAGGFEPRAREVPAPPLRAPPRNPLLASSNSCA